MTQSDNVQSVTDVRDMEVVKEEVGEQVGDTQEDVTRQLQGYKRCDIAKDYVERFDLDELSELTGVDRSAVRDHVDYWLARGQVVEVGEKKHGKSVFSCRPIDIGQAKFEEIDVDEISTQQTEVADRLGVTDAVVEDMFEALTRSANPYRAGERGDSQNEGDS